MPAEGNLVINRYLDNISPLCPRRIADRPLIQIVIDP